MQDETIDDATATFLAEMQRSFRVTEPPCPGDGLTSLFAAGLANDKGDLPVTVGSNANGSAGRQTAGLPNWTRRRIHMMKVLLTQLSNKVAAGAVGATLAIGGLGAAGALTVPIQMISDTVGAAEESCDDVATPDVVEECEAVVDETENLENEDEVEEAPKVDEEELEDESLEEGADVTDEQSGELPAVPTRVSEAAKIHDFDEACGNHGKYVSHFARFGEEPECATEARAAADAEAGAEDTSSTEDAGTTVTSEDTVDDGDDESAKAEAKAERKAGKAEAKAAKGKGGKGGGRGRK